MPEQDHVEAFKAAVADQLRNGPQPGGIPVITLPDDHPFAKLLKGLADGQAAAAAPSLGKPPAIDLATAAPILGRALRHIARDGVASGNLSRRKATPLLSLAAFLEGMTPGWLSATVAQVVMVHMAGPEEWACFDGFTQAWFAGHAKVLSRVMETAREMADAGGETRRQPWWKFWSKA